MILIEIIIISLLVFAINYTMLPGEIFGFIDTWWERKKNKLMALADDLICHNQQKKFNRTMRLLELLEKIEQPLFRCPVCMAPYYGTALYWLIPWQKLELPAHNAWEWVIIIMASMGLNSIIVRTFKSDDD